MKDNIIAGIVIATIIMLLANFILLPAIFLSKAVVDWNFIYTVEWLSYSGMIVGLPIMFFSADLEVSEMLEKVEKVHDRIQGLAKDTQISERNIHNNRKD